MNDTELQLAALRDLQVPNVTAWPAAGWWCLLTVTVLAALAWTVWRRRRRQRYWQREARSLISALRERSACEPCAVILAECSILARRLALLHDARSEVASLQGEAWLSRLDGICQQPLFTAGFGRLLLDYPYRANPDVSVRDLDALLDVLDTLALACGRRHSVRKRGVPDG